jgi:hypothetical protein
MGEKQNGPFQLSLLPLNLRREQLFPVVGTVDVAGRTFAARQSPSRLNSNRVIAGRLEVPVVRAVLPSPSRRVCHPHSGQ